MNYPYNKNITAAVLDCFSSTEKRKSILEDEKILPDSLLNSMAEARKIPEEQISIYKSIMKGDMKQIQELMACLGDHWFETGDIIMMTGNSVKSKLLVTSQLGFYTGARSSHIALLYSDFICIDIVPGAAVEPRLITEVLKDAQDGWKIIRKKDIDAPQSVALSAASTYFIAQKYKIFLRKNSKSSKSKSYCSELARKIYQRARIPNTGFPPSGIIAPAHFDKLLDNSPSWEDMTEKLKPAVDFVFQYETIFNIIYEQLRNGIYLNRDRFSERELTRQDIKSKLKKNKITKNMAKKHLASLDEIDFQMHNKFWDHSS